MINKSKLSRGFTLVELMIVVVIVGMLTAVSMGFYGDYVTDASRTDGRSALTTMAAAGEKCKALNGAYNHATCAALFPFTSDDGYYQVTGVATATTYTMTATPIAGQRQANDTDCTSLTLTNTGVKGGTGADPSQCW